MEKKEMKSCKTCGADVAKSAKTCPHCGAKLHKRSSVLIGIVAFFILIAAIAAGGDDEPKKVETTVPEQSQTSEEDENIFYVGETAELRGVRVTLVDATESDGSAFNVPTDGNVYVLCEFEIENQSDKEIAVSSMLSFEAYCDDYTCTFSLGALMEKGNKNQLDGTVAPGKKFNGIVGYEVPADWQEIEIVFTPDFWSGKDITFVAVND